MSESLLQAQETNESLAFKRYFHFCLPGDVFQYARPFYIQISSYDQFNLTTYSCIIYHSPTKYMV